VSGWSGNVATFGFAKQTVKGTPAATPAIKTKFVGGNIKPDRVMGRLVETAGTRDVGPSYTSRSGVSGNPSMYARPDDLASLSLYALGTNVDSGTNPNYTHTATPADTDLPWLTIFKMLAATTGGSAILERFTDCKVDKMTLRGQAGQPLEVALDIVGITPTFLAANDGVAVTVQSPFVYDQLTVSKGGASVLTVDAFEIIVENNLQVMMGNGAITPYDVFPGERKVSGFITLLYENTDNYRTFHYGTTGGTAASRLVFAEQLILTATVNANLSFAATINSATYTDVPVEPSAAGDPIMSQMAFEAEPNPGGSLATFVTKNQLATVG
jgi:Phage tail tube protein